MKEVNYVSRENEYLRQGETIFKGILYGTYNLGNNSKLHVGPIVEEKPDCKMRLRCVILEHVIDGKSIYQNIQLYCNEIEALIESSKEDFAINAPAEKDQDVESKEFGITGEIECMYNVFEKEETEDD